MKKILKFALPMIFATGLLFSCSLFSSPTGSSAGESTTTGGGNDEIKDLPVIDLRIKNAAGQSISRAAEDEAVEFSYKFLEIGGNPKLGLLTREEAKNILTFEDDPQGIKINCTVPEKYDSINWFELVYIDGNANWSTRQQADWFVYGDKRNFSWLYPLVIPGNTVKFVIQLMMGANENEANFQIYYEVTPVHGIGIVDDLPAGYDESKYISYSNGKVSLNNVIPPDSSTIVTKSVGFWGAEHSSKVQVWDGTSDMFSYYPSNIKLDYYGMPTDFYLFTNGVSSKPYFFIQCGYDYTIEGFDGLKFASPRICTDPIENNFFNQSLELRSFSNTKMETTDSGYEVTFSGDTSLDGFFMADTTNPVYGMYFYKGNCYVVEVKDNGYLMLNDMVISLYENAYGIAFTETGFEVRDNQGQVTCTYTKQDDIKSILISN